MNKVYLLIGGNLGDRFKLLLKARDYIAEKIGDISRESAVYETAPWGFESEENFLNQVMLVTTKHSALEVLANCQKIENNMGRTRSSEGYSSRLMDIDILFYNDEIVKKPNLIIPHERLHQRKFTLEPLVEIAPGFTHPILKKSLFDILKECKDNSVVKKL